jgi:hypothetical protein
MSIRFLHADVPLQGGASIAAISTTTRTRIAGRPQGSPASLVM